MNNRRPLRLVLDALFLIGKDFGRGWYRFYVLQMTGAALLAVSQLYYGALSRVWFGDSSHLVGVVAACGLAGLLACLWRDDETYQLSRHFCVGFGLLGTVVGFIGALLSIDPSKATDPAALQGVIAGLIPALGIALYTTLVGLSCAMWLALSRRVSGWTTK